MMINKDHSSLFDLGSFFAKMSIFKCYKTSDF